ncbi:MAG: hypothetical protein F2832_02400 [Actinobacteria bacterium]|nr:hypothetical protein [Actinomycetota bacterium]
MEQAPFGLAAATAASMTGSNATRAAWTLHPALLALGRPRVAAAAAGALLFMGALLGSAVLPGTPMAATGGTIIARVIPSQVDDSASEAEVPADEPAVDDAGDVADLPADPVVPETPAEPTPTPTTPAEEDVPAPTAPASPAPVKHVWVIALEATNVATDPLPPVALAAAPLAAAAAVEPTGLAALRAAGTTLTGYTSIGKGSLANAIPLISGQRATPAQEAGCATYSEVTPGKVSAKTGLVTGDGCVEPPQAMTITDRLTGEGLVWKAYAEDVAAGPTDQSSCRHPELGALDPYFTPRPGDAYLTWRVPFLYFRSITESADCGTSVVGLDRLTPDLATVEDTPSFSYIVPNACHDGSVTPCAADAPTGIAAAEAWLTPLVKQITDSAAYADGGLIVITSTDGHRPNPADPIDPAAPRTPDVVPVGAILLSPYVAAGATITRQYDHLSLLKTLTRVFQIDPLGHAADATVTSFGLKVFANAPAPGSD